MALKILAFKGEEIHPYITDLAKLRIRVFKEYPYLYEGKLEYEMDYLQRYIASSESIMVIVFEGDHIVGVSTAMPLKFELVEFQQPFLSAKMDIEKIFYLGESVLDKAYRGQGVYRHFFEERELAAKKYGCHTYAFCAVERSADDPRRPMEYKPLDEVWQRFGYQKHQDLFTDFNWPEVGEKQASSHRMVFWLKKAE
jgi:GNAT superfamily N-acetyltransferase